MPRKTNMRQVDLFGNPADDPTYYRSAHRARFPSHSSHKSELAVAAAPRFSDLSHEAQMEAMLELLSDVARHGGVANTEAKIDRYLSKIAPPSPAVERGLKRDPIILSPAGKFQRILNAAHE